MDKKVFRGLLDKIRMDKGASAYSPIKKTKIGNNPTSYYDNSNVNVQYSK